MNQEEAAKEKILDAAMSRMIRFGYRKVSMDEIAQDLTMSKNTIYKYFQSKVDIAGSLFIRLEKQINRELTLIEEATQDPQEVIAKSIFFIQKQLGPWFEHFLGDVKMEVPLLYQDFIDFRNEKIADLRGLLERGMKAGKFRKVNSAIGVAMYLGAIDQVLNPEFLQKEKISFPEAIAAVMDIWSSGILQQQKKRGGS